MVKKKENTIKLNDCTTTELYNIERMCSIILRKFENEFVAYNSQYSDKNKSQFVEMNEKFKKYNAIYTKIINEIEKRIGEIS